MSRGRTRRNIEVIKDLRESGNQNKSKADDNDYVSDGSISGSGSSNASIEKKLSMRKKSTSRLHVGTNRFDSSMNMMEQESAKYVRLINSFEVCLTNTKIQNLTFPFPITNLGPWRV